MAIADSFDALSSGRIYMKDAIPPDEVLRKLMYQMQHKFDTVLLKLFVNIIGIFPVGSLVLLSNETVGIVTRTNAWNLHRPEVRVVADAGGELEESTWIDLALPENADIDIIRVVDAHKHKINVSRLVLSS